MEKPDKLFHYASIVQYQVRYLKEQIERLLHYTHAESKHLYLKKENVDLHVLIGEALRNLHPLIQDKKAKVICQLDAERCIVTGDRNYLLIVITNLVENGLKYSVSPVIIVCTQSRNNSFVLSVKDNGKGIEKKFRKQIFRRFYRVPDKEVVQARGFGLGLAFVKRIVQAHNGTIKVESIPGIGSDFQTILPIS